MNAENQTSQGPAVKQRNIEMGGGREENVIPGIHPTVAQARRPSVKEAGKSSM